MTLIIGARCHDRVMVAADRRRLTKYEKGPETNKGFLLFCGVALAKSAGCATKDILHSTWCRPIKRPFH